MAPLLQHDRWSLTGYAILVVGLVFIILYIAYDMYTCITTVRALSQSSAEQLPPPPHSQTLPLQVRRRRHRSSNTFLTVQTRSVEFSGYTPTQPFDFRADSASLVPPIEHGIIEQDSRCYLRSGTEEANHAGRHIPTLFPLQVPAPAAISSNTLGDASSSTLDIPSLASSLKQRDGPRKQTPHPTTPYPRSSMAVELIIEPPRAHLPPEEKSLRYLSLRNNEMDDRRRKEQRDSWEQFVASAGRVVEDGEKGGGRNEEYWR